MIRRAMMVRCGGITRKYGAIRYLYVNSSQLHTSAYRAVIKHEKKRKMRRNRLYQLKKLLSFSFFMFLVYAEVCNSGELTDKYQAAFTVRPSL